MPRKVIYADLSLATLTLDQAAAIKSKASETISKLLGSMELRDRDGHRLTVDVELHDFPPENPIFRSARAARRDGTRHTITLGVGLLAQLHLLARTIAADPKELRGRTAATILTALGRKDGREAILAEFCFHYMLTFVLWHEVAHIALGHLAWLSETHSLGVLDEASTPTKTPEELLTYRTLEADADRQASMWTAGIVDLSLSQNEHLRYRSLADAFFDVGYIYGAMFCFLDSIDSDVPEDQRKHPRPHIRLAVALSFVQDYLRKYHPSASEVLQKQVYEGGIGALKRILYADKRPVDLLRLVSFMAENGERIERLGVRKFQCQISTAKSALFAVV